MTEKRRAQNKAAQIRYREKQKRRLQELEEIARNITVSHVDEYISEHSNMRNNYSESDLSFPEPIEGVSSSAINDSLQRTPIALESLPFLSTSLSPSNTNSNITDPEWLLANNSWNEVLQDISTDLTDLDATQAARDYQASTNSSSITRFSTLPSQTTNFSPYRNHLRLHQLTFLSATLTNAASLNISQKDYFTDALSPFYCYTQSSALSLQESQSFYGTKIKPHLRPSLIQLERSHVPYLDLIIFPSFRKNLVVQTTMPGSSLDTHALMIDMMESGLLCWGSSKSGHGRGGGMPWDLRSWEAKPWFLKKWWFLVGGEDGEVWETSRWWWTINGEEQEAD